MAKAGLLFIGTDDGIALLSNPGAVARWLRVGHELRGLRVASIWTRPDNPLVVLAACGADGLWRSADGGQSWERTVERLASSVTETPIIVLAGKQPAILVSSSAGDQPIILRSADDGASFTPGEPDVPWTGALSVIAPASYHIDTAFAGTEGGQVFSSTDRGRSWQLIRDGFAPIRSIAAARLA